MMGIPAERHDAYDDDLPDPALVWRWVGRATRPVIGWVLLALGGLFILLGWIGVSGESIVAKQIPYVVSGGIAGVVLAIVGAYFLGTEELRKDSGRIDRLERMVLELHETLLQHVDRPVDLSEPKRNGAPNSFVALGDSTTYHRPGCPMIEGKPGVSVMAPSTVRKRALAPCALCEPATVGS